MKYLYIALLIGMYCTSFAQDCPDGDLLLETQGEIDDFSNQYPECQCIKADLAIKSNEADPILNLNNLSNITKIKGSLTITDNSELMDLEGLSNIDTIQEDLRVKNNEVLLSIEGLSGLKTIGKALDIMDNPVLQSLHGLEGIEIIKRDCIIYNNDAIVNLSGLDNVVTIKGWFQIFENDNLINFQGMNKVEIIDDHFLIKVNRKLENFVGFDNLELITGSMQFWKNDSLKNFVGLYKLAQVDQTITITDGNFQNLKGLESLDTIHGLHISDEPQLTSLKALENVVYINYKLDLRALDQLESLSGLENVTTIQGPLKLRHNDGLLTLSALSNVTQIEGDLWIEGNDVLESLDGLQNIDPHSIEIDEFYGYIDLKIKDNNNLKLCNLPNICKFINKDLGEYLIENNAESCLDEEALFESCMTVSTDAQKSNLTKVYPNPFAGYVKIEVAASDFVTITDINGIVMIEKDLETGINTIDLSGLNNGIYFVHSLNSSSFKLIKF